MNISCSKCGIVGKEHFYKNKKSKTGFDAYCKFHRNQASLKYRKSPKGKVAINRADEKYAQTDGGKRAHRKARREYNRSEKGRTKNKEWWKRYKETDKGIEARRKSNQKSNGKRKGTDQYRAQIAITSAIAAQKMPAAKTLPCSICDNQAQHYHHHSYKQEYWLDVIPVCVSCHNEIHLKP